MIIHQIWIGKNAMPSIWMDSVKDFCSSFNHEYILWTDKNIKLLEQDHSFNGVNELIKYIDTNNIRGKYAGMSDIYRLLALYKYGGIYIDADSVVLNNKELHEFIIKRKDKVILGWEFDNHTLIANGVIIAPKYDKFISLCLENIALYAFKRIGEDIWKVTGPRFITDMYKNNVDRISNIEIIERTIFYPDDWHFITDIDEHKYKKFDKHNLLYQYGYSTNGFKDKIDQYEMFKKNPYKKIQIIYIYCYCLIGLGIFILILISLI